MTTQAIHVLEAVAQRRAYRDERADRVKRRRWRATRADLVATLNRQAHKVLAMLDNPHNDKTIYEVEQLTMMILQLTALDRMMR